MVTRDGPCSPPQVNCCEHNITLREAKLNNSIHFLHGNGPKHALLTQSCMVWACAYIWYYMIPIRLLIQLSSLCTC